MALYNVMVESLPSRGAWIEIFSAKVKISAHRSLPSRGAWIEISNQAVKAGKTTGRSPHGERGLKFHGGRDGDSRTIAIPHMVRGD